jgi:CubicO group peptidase (beta-lactamase class C family)
MTAPGTLELEPSSTPMQSASVQDIRVDIRRVGHREIPIRERTSADCDFERSLIDATREYVCHIMVSLGTPGLNLALGYRNRIIWEAAFGFADIAAGAPMTPQTVYHSGSLGKTYTATAVMQLVEQGVVGLDDPVGGHLPLKVINPLGVRQVTIRDLMTHRSGLNTDSAASRFRRPESLAHVVMTEYATDPPARKWGSRWSHPVGEKWIYTNLGLATLGLIVQTRNPEGLSFSEYVQQRVMDPLGMTASQYPEVQDQEHVRPDIWERMSTGYARMGSAWIPTLPVYFGNYPAGTVVGQPSDHLRLLLAMSAAGTYNGYQLLRPETVQTMISPGFEESLLDTTGSSFQQGLIWRIYNRGKINERFNHGGGHMYGWRTQGASWPRYELSLMVASNQWSLPDDSKDVYHVETFIDEWMVKHAAAAADQQSEWACKVSYVRGVLFASSFKITIGIPEELTDQALTRSIDGVRLQSGGPQDWDATAFRRGVADVLQTELSYESIRRLWKETGVVTEPELRTIYEALGGRPEASSYSIQFLP